MKHSKTVEKTNSSQGEVEKTIENTYNMILSAFAHNSSGATNKAGSYTVQGKQYQCDGTTLYQNVPEEVVQTLKHAGTLFKILVKSENMLNVDEIELKK
jgi:hypothetical protein